jgi:hypothetical protein
MPFDATTADDRRLASRGILATARRAEMVEPESDSDLERYVSAVEALVPFAGEERDRLVGRLRDRLSAEVAEHRDGGWSAALSLQVALHPYGSPELMAARMTRARRLRFRLLATMGAAALAAAGGAAGGGLLFLGLTSVPFLGVLDWVHGVHGRLDAGAGLMAAVLGVGVALYLGARLLMVAQDPWAGFSGRQIRRVAAPTGAAVVLALVMFEFTGMWNWLTIAMLTLLPVWWIAGSWQVEPPRFGRMAKPAIALAACAAAAFGASCLASWQPSVIQPEPSPAEAQAWNPRVDRVALATPSDVQANLLTPQIVTTGGNSNVIVSVVIRDRSFLADWHDLRAEAWQDGAAPGSLWFVDPAKTQPVATGQVQWVDGARTLDGIDIGGGNVDGVEVWPAGKDTLTGAVQLHPTTERVRVIAALTGIAPDGHRHLIGYPQARSPWFDGTALDWYQNLLAGN